MRKIIVTIGTSLSGKTTWALEYMKTHKKVYRVSRDDERESLFGVYRQGSQKEENAISEIVKQKVFNALMLGDVILDNTHLKKEYIDNVIETFPNTDIEFKTFPLLEKEELIKRNQKRFEETGKLIPENVIHKQMKDFEALKTPENIYHKGLKTDPRIFTAAPYNPDLPDCLIADLDGTLSLMYRRSPFNGKDCKSDKVNESVRGILDLIYASNLYAEEAVKVVIFSGRNSDNGGREATEQWLEYKDIPYSRLVMREPGDQRPDTIIKKEMYEKHIKDKYNVLFVLDDRPSVIRMWASLGLPVFDVHPTSGEF